MQGKLITIFGGSGFIGRYVVQKLAKQGALIQVAVRHPKSALFLKTMGDIGQITLTEVDITNPQSISEVVGGSYGIVNLIGILKESKHQKFHTLHTACPEAIAKIAAKKGIKRLVHLSAINADPGSVSLYASTKGKGEALILKNFPHATILRPSVVFGAEDRFLNMFAGIARFSPALPLVGGGTTKFQPVYVGDVADAVVKVLSDRQTGKSPFAEKIFELGGPNVISFKGILEYILKCTKRRCLLLPIPYPLASFVGSFLQYLPNALITPDQVLLLKEDNIVHSKTLTFKELDITPRPMEMIAPGYLKRYCRYV